MKGDLKERAGRQGSAFLRPHGRNVSEDLGTSGPEPLWKTCFPSVLFTLAARKHGRRARGFKLRQDKGNVETEPSEKVRGPVRRRWGTPRAKLPEHVG